MLNVSVNLLDGVVTNDDYDWDIDEKKDDENVCDVILVRQTVDDMAVVATN